MSKLCPNNFSTDMLLDPSTELLLSSKICLQSLSISFVSSLQWTASSLADFLLIDLSKDLTKSYPLCSQLHLNQNPYLLFITDLKDCLQSSSFMNYSTSISMAAVAPSFLSFLGWKVHCLDTSLVSTTDSSYLASNWALNPGEQTQKLWLGRWQTWS